MEFAWYSGLFYHYPSPALYFYKKLLHLYKLQKKINYNGLPDVFVSTHVDLSELTFREVGAEVANHLLRHVFGQDGQQQALLEGKAKGVNDWMN